jgi:hypothetical protein
MRVRTYAVTLDGLTPLMMHADNIEWADQMDAWRADPANAKLSKPGDDRTPAFRWIGSLYHDGAHVSLPSDNLMRCMMEGGAMVPVPGGRNGKTFKAQSQSGMMVADPYWPVLVGGATIPMPAIEALMSEARFAEHARAVKGLGFALHMKRGRIGTAKHVRVRPLLRGWQAKGHVNIWDDQITAEVLQQILTFAGRYRGLCDWRPGSKTPGSFGMFTAAVQPIGA